MMHIKFTLMLLFANIVLVLMYPTQVIGDDNHLFTTNANGDYDLDSDFTSATGAAIDQEGGLPKGSFGITDVFTLIWDFLELTIRVLFSSFVLLAYLEGVWRLILGIPVIIAYGFAIMGWFFK